MLTPYEEALESLLERVDRLPTEKVILWDAIGRVVAEDVFADRDSPAFDNSAMDGYAVVSQDLEEIPAKLKVVGEVSAGSEFSGRLERGQAIRIFTGAPIPVGANAVVPVEYTKLEGEYVLIERSFKEGANIRRRGEEIKAGELILKKGTSIITHGVSAGEKDFVHKLVKDMGFEVVFHKLRIKPAKPVLFAKKGRTLFFGLPGNPVSCAMAFDMLVKPALLKMQGVEEHRPKFLKAELLRDFSRKDAERREFVRARYVEKDGRLFCDYSPKTQSHMLTSYVDANCYMVVYEGVHELKAGQQVDIVPFDW